MSEHDRFELLANKGDDELAKLAAKFFASVESMAEHSKQPYYWPKAVVKHMATVAIQSLSWPGDISPHSFALRRGQNARWNEPCNKLRLHFHMATSVAPLGGAYF